MRLKYFAAALLFYISFASAESNGLKPVFLKAGFSSVLEFDELPTQAVVGDGNSFQVERLKNSLVIRPLTTEATTNLIVYFSRSRPQMFLLTASEKAEPTFRLKVDQSVPAQLMESKVSAKKNVKRISHVRTWQFDEKKDHLKISFVVVAGANERLELDWDKIVVRKGRQTEKAYKVWSERKTVQRDTAVEANVIFRAPDLPKDLSEGVLLIPFKASDKSLELKLKGGRS